MLHVIINKLKVEYMDEPMGIDTTAPRLSWQLSSSTNGLFQSAYQIIAASNTELLHEEKPDLWDSGQIKSNQSIQIPYEGKPLVSKQTVYWKVKVWDQNGRSSEWSAPAWWEMTLLHAEEWQAHWICSRKQMNETAAAPLFRKTLSIGQSVKKARAYIAGLGFYELFLDGQKVGDRVLDPGITDYEETVLYSIYDVTSHILKDQLVVDVLLGRGRYAQATPDVWGWEKAPWHDEPKFLFHLFVEYKDGTTQIMASDESWKKADSAIRFDCLLAGETYDARSDLKLSVDADISTWEYAVLAKKPLGQLKSQTLPPIKEMGELRAIQIKTLADDSYVFDFGMMISGWSQLKVSGKAGTEVQLIYGESLYEDGTVNRDQKLVSADIQTDTYILKGKGIESWSPKFSYKGFQYIEVRGYPGTPGKEDLVAKIVHTSVVLEGQFSCSNELFNLIHRNNRRAILNNLHSIPTDTPVYEKNGWTGDAQLTAEAAIYNFNMAAFYTKWVQDLKDSMREDGELAPIVPTSDWGYVGTPFGWKLVQGPVPPWDAAFLLIPWWCYQYYGDQRMLRTHYNGMKIYIAYLEAQSNNHIITNGLGDWLPPNGEANAMKGNPPEGAALTATAYYFMMVDTLQRIASILEENQDHIYYSKLGEKIKASFHRKFFHSSHKYYVTEAFEGFRQTSQILPLSFGMVPKSEEKTLLEKLVHDITFHHDRHLDTGIFGTKYLLNLLTDHGYVDLAFDIANQRTYPSWGYWIEHGATSLWEAWEISSRSRNHHMFATIEDWFYQRLAGIRPLKPGYTSIVIKPHVPSLLDEVSASVETPYGIVSCQWRKMDDLSLKMEVAIPVNTTAKVYVPDLKGNHMIHELSSGNYVFFSQ